MKFRCGGSAVIEKIFFRPDIASQRSIQFHDMFFVGSSTDGAGSIFKADGLVDVGLVTPFDIIEIVPAPFDWSTVRSGNAFYLNISRDETVFYIGKAAVSDGAVMQAKDSMVLFVPGEQLEYGVGA